MKFLRVGILAALVLVIMSGCGDGGGSGNNGGTQGSYTFPEGKSTLAFSALSTAKLPASISGVDLSITLPQGMSVPTNNGLSGPIATDAVQPGTGMIGTNLAFGSYSVSTRKVYLSMVTTSDTFRSGEFLRLVCVVKPNTAITLADLNALNTPVNIKKAVGLDMVTNTTTVFSSSLKVILDPVR